MSGSDRLAGSVGVCRAGPDAKVTEIICPELL